MTKNIVFLLLIAAAPASANLCKENKIRERHFVEAALIPVESYSTLSAPGYLGDDAYNARVIACNRSRDSRGGEIERAYAQGRQYATNLSTRVITGKIAYFNFAPLRYGYLLSRTGSTQASSTWTLTGIARFHFPALRQRRKVDLPWRLATELSLNAECSATHVLGSSGTTPTDFGWMDVGNQNGAIDNGDACRVSDSRLFTNPTFSPALTAPATTQLSAYWKREIEAEWTRPGLQVKFLILGYDQIPDSVIARLDGSTTVASGSTITINSMIWDIQFNHRPQSRVTYHAVIGKSNGFYEGTSAATFVHEFGHSVGLDDEYPEIDPTNPNTKHPERARAWRQCDALGGADYVMCKGDSTGSNDQKSVYPWILTRRYAVGIPFNDFCPPNEACPGATTTRTILTGTATALTRCRQDDDCPNMGTVSMFCDKNGPGRGNNACSLLRSECSPCTRNGQCASGHCDGKPDGKCAPAPGTGILAAGATCCRDSQCSSRRCARTVTVQFGECR